MLEIQWTGNLGWLVEGEGKLLAFDLDLGSSIRKRPPPVTAAGLAPRLDVLFITHAHGDHFNDATARVLAKRSACTFVLPETCLKKARTLGIKRSRIRVAVPRKRMKLHGIAVTPYRAIHGHKGNTIYKWADMRDCGYLLEFAGKRVFQPGDTVLLEEHMVLEDIDVLFVSPTEHNMHVGPAARWIRKVKPKHVFAQHFGTYVENASNRFWTHGSPDTLKRSLPVSLQKCFHKPTQGRSFTIE